MHIWLDEIDGFIEVYDGVSYLVLFLNLWYEEIYDRIRYLISYKSGLTNSINLNFVRIRIDSFSPLPTEKILTFHNVIILSYNT